MVVGTQGKEPTNQYVASVCRKDTWSHVKTSRAVTCHASATAFPLDRMAGQQQHAIKAIFLY